jgi:hypothetical protein
MADDPHATTVLMYVADLVALEGEIEAALAGQRDLVAAHPGAGAAVRRFHILAQGQRGVLSEHLLRLGGDAAATRERERSRPPSLPALLPPPAAPASARLPVCAALRGDYTAFHHAALGYGLLWGIAHRAYAERAAQPTFRLAEQHQRAYAAAAHEVVLLLTDVLAWELNRRGEPCRCLCPACRGLGLCICVGGAQSVTVDNFAETVVRDGRGVLVRQLRAGGPADRVGLRVGDVIEAVDGAEVPDPWKLNPCLEGFRSGRPVRLRVRQAAEGTRDVTVAP